MNKWNNKTRGGKDVRIYAEDGVGTYSIHGAIRESAGWITTTWTKDGKNEAGGSSDEDIIPNTPTHDWSKEPAWVKAVAMDASGNWFRFDGVPELCGNVWMRESYSAMHPSEYPDYDGDFESSLMVRPEGGAK